MVSEFPPDRVQEACASGAERLAVAGGDGSIAPAAEAAGAAGIPLAVIPAGTANDFARAMGLPGETAAACRLAARGEGMRHLDLGRMEGRPFVNVASAGLPPVAASEASGLKRALGPLAYLAGALRAGLTARPVRCEAGCDGEGVHEGGAWQVTVACSGAFGGGASVPADPGDGMLDLVVIPAGSRLTLAWRAYGLRSGRIGEQSEVSARRCREARIAAPSGIPFNVDGEIVDARSARFSAEPAAFALIVPSVREGR